VEVARGDLARARECLKEAVSMAREPGNRPILPPALHNWGSLMLLEDDLEGAAALFEEGLALSREDGRIEGVEVNLLALARVEIRRGRYADARRRLAEGARIAEERWMRVRGQALLDETAALAAALEEHAVAARLWGASEAARREMNLSREPNDESFLGPWTERARAALGTPAFTAAEVAGAALSYAEALAEARAWLESPRA
jgi:ATP/maltotriose-dependent transcriptional regulator MalT